MGAEQARAELSLALFSSRPCSALPCSSHLPEQVLGVVRVMLVHLWGSEAAKSFTFAEERSGPCSSRTEHSKGCWPLPRRSPIHFEQIPAIVSVSSCMSSWHSAGFSELEVPQLAFAPWVSCHALTVPPEVSPSPSQRDLPGEMWNLQGKCGTCSTRSFLPSLPVAALAAVRTQTGADVAPGAGSGLGFWLGHPQLSRLAAPQAGPDAAAAAWLPDSLSPWTSPWWWHCWGDVAVTHPALLQSPGMGLGA